MPSLFARLLKALLLVYLLSSNAMADTLKGPEEARALVERVMAKGGAGDSAGGIEMIRPFLIIPTAEFDVMFEQLKLQTPVIAQRFGKSIGHEFIPLDVLLLPW